MPILKVLSAPKGSLTVETETGVYKRNGGTVSWRCQNVGNIKYGEFAKKFGAVGKDFGGHAVFPTEEHGKKAKYDLLFNKETSRYYPLTLLAAMRIYAPVDDPDADNKPDEYAKFLAQRVGINTSTKLCDLAEPQRVALLDYISKFEGYKVGIIEKVSGDEPEPTTGTKMDVKYIQKWLKDKGQSISALDNDPGPETIAAITAYLTSIGVASVGWNKARKLLAIEQAIYKAAGQEIGNIDGLMGPQTQYIRTVWEAKQSGDEKKVEEITTFKDKPAKNVWPYQSECRTYYGNVGENQTMLQLPFDMYLAWEKKTVIKRFSIHEKVHDSAKRCFERIANEYDAEARKKTGIDLFGGCLNVRKMRGGSSWSMHSWGIAIDFDPDRNQLQWGRDKARLAKPDCEAFWKIWEDEGWVSLGRARNYDHMHVQAARLD